MIWPTDLTLPTSSIADRPADLSDECRRLATAVLAITPVITTVADRRPNRIVSVERDGIMVHTEKSASTGSAQLVPAWMIEVAWDHLRRTGSLTQRHLLSTDGLNVKRSAFVLALLARFPGVRVVSTRPSELSFTVQ